MSVATNGPNGEEVLKQAKEQKSRAEAVHLVSESAMQVSQAEAALKEAQDAEAPFLKGIEGMPAAIWMSAISTCEVRPKHQDGLTLCW
eukprot:2523194-Amphidinium_carterae.1